MKKKYYIDWRTKNGRPYFKGLGHDEEEAIRFLEKKIKARTTISAYVSYGWVGSDTPDEEIGKAYFVKGYYKQTEHIGGIRLIFEDNIIEMKTKEGEEI